MVAAYVTTIVGDEVCGTIKMMFMRVVEGAWNGVYEVRKSVEYGMLLAKM